MRRLVIAVPIALALLWPQSGCGKSEKEIEEIVKKEQEKTEKALKELEEAKQGKERLRKLNCELLCVQLKQAQSIGPYVGSGRKAEYDALITTINANLQALGCPPCG
jgi:hypothetical protein